MKVFRLLFLSAFLVMSVVVVNGQNNYATENSIWNKGMMLLANGKALTGEINYNFITGVVSYKNSGGSESHHAKSVAYFQVSGSDDSEYRKFYSFPFEVDKGRGENYFFFEVVHENDEIAILSRHEYEYKERTASSGAVGNPAMNFPNHVIIVEKVIEVLYLANRNGEMVEYGRKNKDKNYSYILFQQYDEHSGDKYDESKTNRADDLEYNITTSNALAYFTGVHYQSLKKFTKEEKLNLRTIEGLTRYLDKYASME